MVGLVIAVPAMVMHYKGAASTIDPNTIKIEVPQIEMPPLDFGPPTTVADPVAHTEKPRSFSSGLAAKKPGLARGRAFLRFKPVISRGCASGS